MKQLFWTTFLVALATSTLAQQRTYEKLHPDTSVLDAWPYVEMPSISHDGNYISYTIQRLPKGNHTLVLQGVSSIWKQEYIGARPGTFSTDNKYYIFSNNDTLRVAYLGAEQVNDITGVNSFKQPFSGKSQWLAYQLKNTDGQLVLYHLATNKEEKFKNVTDYAFDRDGNVLLLVTTEKHNTSNTITIRWIDLSKKVITSRPIWSVENNADQNITISSYAIEGAGTQFAFIVQEKEKKQINSSIWYYKNGMDKAILKVRDQAINKSLGLPISNAPSLEFSPDGRYIFFKLQQTETLKPDPDMAKLDVWSYQDTVLQSTQLCNSYYPLYTAVIDVIGNQVIRLEQDYERIVASSIKGGFVVIAGNKMGDRFWLKEPDTYWLMSLKDGTRKLIKKGPASFYFSLGGKYLVYYNAEEQGHYFSLDLQTGREVDISKGITPWAFTTRYEYIKWLTKEDSTIYMPAVGIAAWLKEDAGLLVYDNYDIWQLDLTGKKRPQNITNGYGKTHHIKFRLLDKNLKQCLRDTAGLLLSAINIINKQNGFYRKSLEKKGNPELLTMGPYTFYHDPGTIPLNADEFCYNNLIPLKAMDANIWMVKRESVVDAPNYFLTTDLKNYKPITNLQPQKRYNWLTAELISWQQAGGITNQGVLYKPENFDPQKKYPVLITYYEQLSHRLYEYPMPEFTKHSINIPWFVSQGYLVFTPDIYFTRGRPGQSVYDAVVSAAQNLSKMPFVDAKRMGINGHSTGGFLTNYLITHTNLFAAAIEGAGTSDWISSSLQLAGGLTKNGSRLAQYEGILGPTLWECPDLYIENSPVLRANYITTPLIIFHSKIDGAVPWEQGVELFIAMRRLGKKVWMLQYDEGNHGVWNKNDYTDYTIRITQFFDHYLKGAPPPKWMTEGIPAQQKGIKTGYELDTSGRQP